MIYVVIACIIVLFLALATKKSKSSVLNIEGVPIVSISSFKHDMNEANDHIAQIAFQTKLPFLLFDSLAQKRGIMIVHPDAAQEVLKNDTTLYTKTHNFKSIFSRLAEGTLIVANGDLWRRVRTAMSPAFQFDYYSRLMPITINKVEELLFSLPIEEPIEITKWTCKLSIDIIGAISFGVDFNMLKGENISPFITHYNDHSNVLASMSRWKEMLPLPSVKKIKHAREEMYSFIRNIITERRGQEKLYLIDALLDNDSLNPHELEKNALLFFLAGHDTNSSTMNWAMWALAKYPEYQEKLRAEVDKVLRGRHVTPDALKDLVYMEMFLKEVLRYGSPVAMSGNVTSRYNQEDTYIAGHFIPKNTPIATSIYTLHRSPEFWSDAYTFNPDRFANPPSHPCAYLPFIYGRRSCNGRNLSIMNQKVFLCELLQKFKVNFAPGAELDEAVSFAPTRTPVSVKIVLSKI